MKTNSVHTCEVPQYGHSKHMKNDWFSFLSHHDSIYYSDIVLWQLPGWIALNGRCKLFLFYYSLRANEYTFANISFSWNSLIKCHTFKDLDIAFKRPSCKRTVLFTNSDLRAQAVTDCHSATATVSIILDRLKVNTGMWEVRDYGKRVEFDL